MMSSSRLFCRLAVLSLLTLEPTYAHAEAWVDVAAALWRSGDGLAHVAVGFSGAQDTGEAATASAIQQCQGAGGRGCRNLGPVRGCAYIVAAKTRDGVAFGAGGSPEDAIASAKEAGAVSWGRPIGGCGN